MKQSKWIYIKLGPPENEFIICFTLKEIISSFILQNEKVEGSFAITFRMDVSIKMLDWQMQIPFFPLNQQTYFTSYHSNLSLRKYKNEISNVING